MTDEKLSIPGEWAWCFHCEERVFVPQDDRGFLSMPVEHQGHVIRYGDAAYR